MARKKDKLLTVEEAAQALDVSVSSVWRMLRRGDLQGVRQSGRRLVRLGSTIARTLKAPEAKSPKPFTSKNPLWHLVGAFRSGGDGPGSSDKYGVLYE